MFEEIKQGALESIGNGTTNISIWKPTFLFMNLAYRHQKVGDFIDDFLCISNFEHSMAPCC